MTDTMRTGVSSACPWEACVPWDDGVGMEAFDSGLASANVWLTKAGAAHRTGRVRTHVLVRGAARCGFFSMRQITVRGASEDKDEVASHLVWVALDLTHHGARLGKRLVLESLAASVRIADQSPFRYIVLDVAVDAASHVRAMYTRLGFVETSAGSRRLRMKVSTARRLVEAACAAGLVPVTWTPEAAPIGG
jgi:ribosomal protein S18 acetylase RimI-like enzyme